MLSLLSRNVLLAALSLDTSIFLTTCRIFGLPLGFFAMIKLSGDCFFLRRMFQKIISSVGEIGELESLFDKKSNVLLS